MSKCKGCVRRDFNYRRFWAEDIEERLIEDLENGWGSISGIEVLAQGICAEREIVGEDCERPWFNELCEESEYV